MIQTVRQRWTPAEDDVLREMALSGENSIAIGLRLKKTEWAVRSRAFRLKISLNPKSTLALSARMLARRALHLGLKAKTK
jgi:hypothetical protein